MTRLGILQCLAGVVLMATASGAAEAYSVVMLGDVHFDSADEFCYHREYRPDSDYLKRAIAALSALPATRFVKASKVRETEPVDVPPEFAALKFLNQLAVFETTLEPLEFSRRMHAIEDALGRVRTVRNGPRTIDLDLIDFGGLVMDDPELTLPHPRAHLRDFVLRPLEELFGPASGDLFFCYNTADFVGRNRRHRTSETQQETCHEVQ